MNSSYLNTIEGVGVWSYLSKFIYPEASILWRLQTCWGGFLFIPSQSQFQIPQEVVFLLMQLLDKLQKCHRWKKYKLHFCKIYLYMEQISPQLAAKNSERGKSASKEQPWSHRYVEF